MLRAIISFALLALPSSDALLPSPRLCRAGRAATSTRLAQAQARPAAAASRAGSALVIRHALEDDDDEEIDPDIAARLGATNFDKLREEAQNPFRAIRFFVYAASGFSAFIGLLTAATQLAGGLGGAPNALPVEQTETNVGVNLAVVLVCGFLYKLDSDGQASEIAKMNSADAAKKEKAKISAEVASEREKTLAGLELMVNVGGDASRQVTVGTLNAEARQNVVIVSGKRQMVQDALLKAQIMGERFQKQNILVVPLTLTRFPAGDAAKGFGRTKAEEKPYVAQAPEGLRGDWEEYIEAEFADAEGQAMDEEAATALRDTGIVIVVKKTGKIVRRGLGVPAWDMIIADLAKED